MTPQHIAEAFAGQAKACKSLGSPFMGRLMGLCATRIWPEGPVTDRIFAWDGDVGPRGQSVPLRFAGALHALFLQSHPALLSVYPPATTDDELLWIAVCAVLAMDPETINKWLDSPPQTNEVRRSSTLIAAAHWLRVRHDLPLRTSELGASGGLNLHWDAFALSVKGKTFGPDRPALTLQPDWDGPLPPDGNVKVASRGGVDLNPLDPSNPADALRLQAYLWPDQPDRMSLTRAAIRASETRVENGDAVDWLKGRLPHVHGQTHLIYSTIAWQYFPTAKQTEGTAAIETAGELATDDSPLAWFGMENDGGNDGAALKLRLWPGDLQFNLGRADFHGRWIKWLQP